MDHVFRHVQVLQQPLLDWAAASGCARPLLAGRAPASGILSLRVDDAAGLNAALAKAGITCVPREGAVRFAPHFYNTTAEMERVVDVLRAALE
jgi:cysteine desulfurase / selenocysteine lyase